MKVPVVAKRFVLVALETSKFVLETPVAETSPSAVEPLTVRSEIVVVANEAVPPTVIGPERLRTVPDPFENPRLAIVPVVALK